jgi:short-subunit dehydrogenase
MLNVKYVLITGCSSGIGYQTAIDLHNNGYIVIATIRGSAVPKELVGMGINVRRCELDDEKSVEALINDLLYEKVPLFAIINNAGFGQMGAVEDISRKDLEYQFAVNVFGTHQLTKGLLPILINNKQGKIINISSVLGYVAMPLRGAYIASKYALEGLSDTLRLELFGTGVDVVLIEPGPIDTKFRINAYKKFLQTIKYKDSRWCDSYELMMKRLTTNSKSSFTLQSTSVSKKILRALGDNPSPRYLITFPSKLFWWLKKNLSIKMLDRILRSSDKK